MNSPQPFPSLQTTSPDIEGGTQWRFRNGQALSLPWRSAYFGSSRISRMKTGGQRYQILSSVRSSTPDWQDIPVRSSISPRQNVYDSMAHPRHPEHGRPNEFNLQARKASFLIPYRRLLSLQCQGLR